VLQSSRDIEPVNSDNLHRQITREDGMKIGQATLIITLSVTISACSDDTTPQSSSTPAAIVSSDTVVQAAYEGCTRDMTQEMISDNPGTAKDIMQMMLQPIPGMCNGAVVKPCEKDREGFLCKTMITEYKDK